MSATRDLEAARHLVSKAALSRHKFRIKFLNGLRAVQKLFVIWSRKRCFLDISSEEVFHVGCARPESRSSLNFWPFGYGCLDGIRCSFRKDGAIQLLVNSWPTFLRPLPGRIDNYFAGSCAVG